MARAMWKGVLSFGAVEIPVKLYAAVQDRDIHFHLLHDQDLVRLKQRMVNPATGKEVALGSGENAADDRKARKGVEIEPGRFVVLTDEELNALEPPSSRDIRIDRFLDPQVIKSQWYDRPYFLGPDDAADGSAYWSLCAALGQQKKEGLARWVMRKKEYLGALRVEGDYLTLITLRFAGQVVPVSELRQPGGRAPEAREIKAAEQLVSALRGKFDPAQYHDEYRQRVEQFIRKKARGEKIMLPKARARKSDGSLAELLSRSLKSVRAKERAHAA